MKMSEQTIRQHLMTSLHLFHNFNVRIILFPIHCHQAVGRLLSTSVKLQNMQKQQQKKV